MSSNEVKSSTNKKRGGSNLGETDRKSGPKFFAIF